MSQRKKAGCTGYANVTDDYMLYNAASGVTPKTAGARRRRGGDGFQDILGQANNVLSSLVPTVPQTFQPPSVSPTTTGGSRRGRGGCTSSCSSARKGGAIELAPFAASLAFLAARMSMDDKINFTKLLRLNSSASKSPKPSTSRSRKTS